MLIDGAAVITDLLYKTTCLPADLPMPDDAHEGIQPGRSRSRGLHPTPSLHTISAKE